MSYIISILLNNLKTGIFTISGVIPRERAQNSAYWTSLGICPNLSFINVTVKI